MYKDFIIVCEQLHLISNHMDSIEIPTKHTEIREIPWDLPTYFPFPNSIIERFCFIKILCVLCQLTEKKEVYILLLKVTFFKPDLII